MSSDERRWSELCARKALGRYYRAKGVKTRWEKGRPDPPDWWAYLDGVRFAIEVTRAYGSFVPVGDTDNRPAAQQWTFFSKLGGELHSLVSAIPGSGSHSLHMQAMMITRDERTGLQGRVRDYVLCHLSEPRAPECVVLEKKGNGEMARITIAKISSRGAGLGWSYSEGSLPRGGNDIEQELRQIVADAVRKKTLGTSKIEEPKLLVIVDIYDWAPESFWEELQFEAAPFAAIFRASPAGYGQLLAKDAVCCAKSEA